MFINYQSILSIEPDQPNSLKEWGEYQGSLTDKLKQLKGDTHLQLIIQKWISTGWWNKYFLGIDDPKVFQREIIMHNEGTAYWYARSLVPQGCYDANPEFFNRLETESIKTLIFDDNRVSRIKLVNYSINSHSIEYYWLTPHLTNYGDDLWVRAAEYSYQQMASFYVVEILLPQLGTIS